MFLLTADRAKQIKTKATVNEDPTEKLIRDLKEENARLKALLEGGNIDPSLLKTDGADKDGDAGDLNDDEKERELEEMRKQVEENEKEMEDMEKSYEEKLAAALANQVKLFIQEYSTMLNYIWIKHTHFHFSLDIMVEMSFMQRLRQHLI